MTIDDILLLIYASIDIKFFYGIAEKQNKRACSILKPNNTVIIYKKHLKYLIFTRQSFTSQKDITTISNGEDMGW